MYEEFSIVQKLILWVPPILIAIIVHEVSHGVVAFYLGDHTAKLSGRLTLNPLKHIDLLGTIIVPLTLFFLHANFLFGWAKPVPVDQRNLKKPFRDMALVALAGPLSNFIMALLWVLVLKTVMMTNADNPASLRSLGFMAEIGIYFNVILGVVNLFPIPPLDGSRVLVALLPRRVAHFVAKLEPFGFVIVLLLLSTGVLHRILGPVIVKILQVIMSLIGLK